MKEDNASFHLNPYTLTIQANTDTQADSDRHRQVGRVKTVYREGDTETDF